MPILNPNEVLEFIKQNEEKVDEEQVKEINQIKETANTLLEIIKNNIKTNAITKTVSIVTDKKTQDPVYILNIKCFRGSMQKNEADIIPYDEQGKVLKAFKNLLKQAGFLYGDENYDYKNGSINILHASIYNTISQEQYEELYQSTDVAEDTMLQEYYDKYLCVQIHR